jgi:hypothetical protein
MRKIKFMIHKKLSSTHYLTVNISGLDGDSLENGTLGCTTCSEETSTVTTSLDGAGGNGGRGVGMFCRQRMLVIDVKYNNDDGLSTGRM